MSKSLLIHRTTLLTLCLVLIAGLFTARPGAQGTSAVRSPDGKFEAVVDRTMDRTTVYRVESGGRAEWYAIPGALEPVFLAAGGQFVATCEHWLDQGYKSKEVVVRFYRTGSDAGTLKLKDVVDRPKSLKGHSGRTQWGQCTGFTGPSLFEMVTAEKKTITYDVRSEKQETGPGVWPPPPVVVEKPNVPRHCTQEDLFCDRFIDYLPGYKQVRGKWEYLVEKGDRLLHQVSDSAREANALMYFDNLNIADADISTSVKMDFEYPQVAIAEDEPRVRRLRRIAGAGIVFRLQDENNFYMFRIAGEEGLVLGKMVDGEWFDLANPRAEDKLSAKLSYAQWFGLRVRVRGDLIQAWIVELPIEGGWPVERAQAVVNLRDNTFSTGRVGLTTFHVKAKYSFLRVLEQ